METQNNLVKINIGYTSNWREADAENPLAIIEFVVGDGFSKEGLIECITKNGFNFYNEGPLSEQLRNFKYIEIDGSLFEVENNNKMCRPWISIETNNERTVITSQKGRSHIMECGPFLSVGETIMLISNLTLKNGLKLTKVLAADCSDDILTQVPSMEEYENFTRPDYKVYFGDIGDDFSDYPASIRENIFDLKKKYDDTGKISCIGITGAPGTGKTTLAKRIAKYITKRPKSIEIVTAANLKAAYVGQTGALVFDLLRKADEENKILFIDEAYTLMDDTFGKEAATVILKWIDAEKGDRLMRPSGKRESEFGRTDDSNVEYIYKGNVSIWIGGYDNKIRKMISKNPGLYRRFEILELETPDVDTLYNVFKNDCDESAEKDPVMEASVREFLSWSSRPEYSEYSASYAGVKKLSEKYNLRKSRNNDKKSSETIMSEIIDEYKQEIKRQYRAQFVNPDGAMIFKVEDNVSTLFEDIAGYAEVKEKLKSVINILSNSESFMKNGIDVPKGMLMVGPPGVGKSLFAKATAGELNKICTDKKTAFIAISGADLIAEPHTNNQGYIIDNIKALFSLTEDYDSTIIFIDEIDAIGKKREINPYYSRMLQLMKEMDGFDKNKNVYILAATNSPELLDPALKRPGRFDRIVEIDLPEKETREEILTHYIRKINPVDEKKLANNKLFTDVINYTAGYSAVELKNLVNETAISCRKTDLNNLDSFFNKLLEKKEEIEIGEIRKDYKDGEFDLSKNSGCTGTAVHETGHALMSVRLFKEEPFRKATIIGRGNALGYVIPKERKYNTKKDYLNKICVLLAGRVAEEIVFGEDEISGGAISDIKEATKIAEYMVSSLGMSNLGPVAFMTKTGKYLDGDNQYTCSNNSREKVDEEINRIINSQYKKAKELLMSSKEELIKISKYLYEKETITGNEFMKLI